MIFSLLLYYGITIIPTFILYNSRNASPKSAKNYVAIFCAIVIPSFLYAIRYNVGTDWFTYYDYYSWVSFDISWKSTVLEFGYYYLMVLCKTIGLNFYGFSFVCCCLLEGSILKAMNNFNLKKYEWLGYYVSLFSLYFVAYNITRQMMATAFIILSYSYYKTGKKAKSVFFIILAVSFHKTAILGFVIIGISNVYRKLHLLGKTNTIVISLIVSCVSAVVLIPLISLIQSFGIYQFDEYAAHAFDAGELRFLLYYIPEWILVYLFLRKRSDTKLYECYSIFMLGCVFQFMACIYPLIDRLSWYFVGFRVLLYSMICSELSQKMKKQFCLLSILWFVTYFFIMYYVLPGDNLFPYKAVFQYN